MKSQNLQTVKTKIVNQTQAPATTQTSDHKNSTTSSLTTALNSSILFSTTTQTTTPYNLKNLPKLPDPQTFSIKLKNQIWHDHLRNRSSTLYQNLENKIYKITKPIYPNMWIKNFTKGSVICYFKDGNIINPYEQPRKFIFMQQAAVFREHDLELDLDHADFCHECFYQRNYCVKKQDQKQKKTKISCKSPCKFDTLGHPRTNCLNNATCHVNFPNLKPYCTCKAKPLLNSQITLYNYTGDHCEIQFIPILTFLVFGTIFVFTATIILIAYLTYKFIKQKTTQSSDISQYEYSSYLPARNLDYSGSMANLNLGGTIHPNFLTKSQESFDKYFSDYANNISTSYRGSVSLNNTTSFNTRHPNLDITEDDITLAIDLLDLSRSSSRKNTKKENTETHKKYDHSTGKKSKKSTLKKQKTDTIKSKTSQTSTIYNHFTINSAKFFETVEIPKRDYV